MAGKDHPEFDDAELVASANRGDERAFEVLYFRYRDWAARVARRFVPADDVGDVLQDAFGYFFGKFPGFELRGTVKGVLYPAIKHLALNRLRRRRPTVTLDEVPDTMELGTAADVATPADLAGPISRLGPLQQEILLLRFADDMSLAHIAEVLGIPVGTAKSRLHNAIEALRATARS